MNSPIKLFLTSVLLISATVSFAQKAIPSLDNRRVHDDEAHVLSQQTIDQLESQLKIYQDSTSNQIAILIISSLEGEALEDYSIRVAHNEWKLGQKDKDNGVLLLIAIDDHKMRIEVGYGLEGVLPDAICSRIIRNDMAPQFRQGDYDAGVILAINAIIRAIGGEYVADDSDDSGGDMQMTTQEKIMMGLFVFGILGLFTFIGIVSEGGQGWVLYFFLIPFYAVFPGAILGWGLGLRALGAYVVGYPILKTIFKKMGWTKKFKSTGGGGSDSWSSGSGWYSGGSSGSSSSSDSFSGGGGGFGGGGASGSW